jgi:hypothetical protein
MAEIGANFPLFFPEDNKKSFLEVPHPYLKNWPLSDLAEHILAKVRESPHKIYTEFEINENKIKEILEKDTFNQEASIYTLKSAEN